MGLAVITFSSINCRSGPNANSVINSSYKSFLKYADYTKLSFLPEEPLASCSAIIISVKHLYNFIWSMIEEYFL